MVLNIDDDEAGRYALSHQLRKAGFEVVEAATGTDGLRLAMETKPELILLDIRLPDISGFEVCRVLREQRQTEKTPILQLSASYLDPASRVQSLEGGADAFLTKPVEPSILLATVRSLLRLSRAEERVRDTAIEWTTTFDAIQDGVALLNLEGKVVRANKRYLAITEKHSVHCEPLLPRLHATLRRQCSEQVEGQAVLQINLDPVLNADGELRGSVCTVAEVTERRRFDERLQHAQKLESIGVLAGGIAHDFNNLLTGILGNASLLLDELPQASASYEMAQEIVKASESAADLTRQLLAYAGKGRFVMQHLNLSEQIASNKTLLTRLIPHTIQLELHLAPDLPALEADSTQLQQIVMNLVMNAAESFGERGKGTVVVTTEAQEIAPGHTEMAPGKYVVLTVADTGAGMTPEIRARIFDPFFTTKFTGRGLGLSAVHGILRAHHGHLELETESGKGTKFKLYLPAIANQAAEAQTPLVSELSAGDGAVLVIDDEATVRNFAEAALTKMGYRVLLAENGQSGLEMLQGSREKISAVLLDFSMPVMDGEEALERIREIDPHLPVIISTGFSVNTELERLTKKGATAFLPKPFTASQLSTTLYRI